jgi:hypothetical protein
MIYVLFLEHNKWYIGFTDRDVETRVAEHFEGKGSVWTYKYKPLQLIETLEGTPDDEDKLTLKYMNMYGWQNVRGGKWCQINLAAAPTELRSVPKSDTGVPNVITNIIDTGISIIGAIGSIFGKIANPSDTNSEMACYRCGRNSHFVNDCYATTHINGKILGKNNSIKKGCKRCGRTSHSENDCYAKTHVNGSSLG